jgi:thiol:disulfide interchange protein
MQSHTRGTVNEIASQEQFRDIVFNNKDKLIVCDYFATWCGPCVSSLYHQHDDCI